MADNISPEEKLFNIIQKEKKAPSGDTDKKKVERRPLISERLRHFFSAAKPAFSVDFHRIELKKLNKLLVVIVIILAAAVIYNLTVRRPSIAKITAEISKIEFQKMKKSAIENFKPLSAYLENVEKRNILHPAPVAKKKSDTPGKRKPVMASTLTNMSKGLKLKGISWGKSPKAMIKDEKDDKIYFVKPGQTVGSSGVEVKSISKDKVLIGYGTEEKELL